MSSSRRQYPFHLIEPKWQQTWDEQQAFRAFNPGDEIPANHPFAIRHGADSMSVKRWPAARPRRSFTSSTCFRIRAARACTSGIPKATRPRTFWRATNARMRLQRAASDGLGCVRPARRAIRRQDRPASARDDRGEHRQLHAPDQKPRLQLRLVARTRHDRRGIFQMDAMDFSQALQLVVQSGNEQGRAD